MVIEISPERTHFEVSSLSGCYLFVINQLVKHYYYYYYYYYYIITFVFAVFLDQTPAT